jgi:hypothetical protein
VTPLQKVFAKFPNARRCGKGWSDRCPAHDDRKPSLSFREDGDGGKVLMHCHAGCETKDICAARGLTLRDLFPEDNGPTSLRNGQGKPKGRINKPKRKDKPKDNGPVFPTDDEAIAAMDRIMGGKHTAKWPYCNADGEVVGWVLRWPRQDGGKEIRPVSLHKNGWRLAAMPEPRPLYNLPDVLQAKVVIVCEGEKCAEKFRAHGFVATTSAGGSSVAHLTDWTPMAGREVWFFPDNDKPGRKYESAVPDILLELVPRPLVKVVKLPNLPEKGDIEQWIEAQGDAAEPENMKKEIEAMAALTEPIMAEADESSLMQFVPFPVKELPEPLRTFTSSAAKSLNCDTSYLALPLLVAAAAAIGYTRLLELKPGWLVPAILWGIIIGESGSGKTPALRQALKPMRKRQAKAFKKHKEAMEQHEAEMAVWKKDNQSWERGKGDGDVPPEKPAEPVCERLIVSDTTVEALAPILATSPRGLLLGRDEVDAWFGSFDKYAGKGKGGSDAANWLSMHSGEEIIVDRKSGTPRTIHVPHAAVCVVGGIQPGVLRRTMGREHRESGLLARPLLTFPPRKAKRWIGAGISPTEEACLQSLFDRLYSLQSAKDEEGQDRPEVLAMTPEAMNAYIAFCNAHGQQQMDTSGDLAAAWSKLEETPARLALVIHFIRWAAHDKTLASAGIIDAMSMRVAIVLTEWFKNETRRIYAMLDEGDEGHDQRRLLEWLQARGGEATAREVARGCSWLKKAGQAEAALEELKAAGLGKWEVRQHGGPGRQATVFVLASRLATSTTTDATPSTPATIDTIARNTAENAIVSAPGASEASFPPDCVDAPRPARPDAIPIDTTPEKPAAKPFGIDTISKNAGKNGIASRVDSVDGSPHIEPDDHETTGTGAPPGRLFPEQRGLLD